MSQLNASWAQSDDEIKKVVKALNLRFTCLSIRFNPNADSIRYKTPSGITPKSFYKECNKVASETLGRDITLA